MMLQIERVCEDAFVAQVTAAGQYAVLARDAHGRSGSVSGGASAQCMSA